MELIRTTDKTPFRALEANLNARMVSIEQALKRELLCREQNVTRKEPNSNDELLHETMRVQTEMGKSLNRTLTRASESVHIGHAVAAELQAQKEQTIQIESVVREVDVEIVRIHKTMGAFLRRVASDRLIICCAFILFTLIIIVSALAQAGTLKG